MLLCGVSCVQTSNTHYSYSMYVHSYPYTFSARLSFEWIALDWIRHSVAIRTTNTYMYRNNATVKRVFHSAYEIIRCDVAANTKVCAPSRPSTVIIERQIRPDWALTCYTCIGMCLRCRRFSRCFFVIFLSFLFDRIPIPWANDRHEMHLPCIFFLCLLSLEFRSLSVIFRMELFFLFFPHLFVCTFFPFVHFSIAWLDQDAVVRCRCYEIHSTDGSVDVSRLQTWKGNIYYSNGAHVHIEWLLKITLRALDEDYRDRYMVWSYGRCKSVRAVDTISIYGDVSLNSKPNYFASWPACGWRIIFLLIYRHTEFDRYFIMHLTIPLARMNGKREKYSFLFHSKHVNTVNCIVKFEKI